MKRNLSSKTIKTMAIALSVALGSSTAVSGVVGGVSTVKADDTPNANDQTQDDNNTSDSDNSQGDTGSDNTGNNNGNDQDSTGSNSGNGQDDTVSNDNTGNSGSNDTNSDQDQNNNDNTDGSNDGNTDDNVNDSDSDDNNTDEDDSTDQDSNDGNNGSIDSIPGNGGNNGSDQDQNNDSVDGSDSVEAPKASDVVSATNDYGTYTFDLVESGDELEARLIGFEKSKTNEDESDDTVDGDNNGSGDSNDTVDGSTGGNGNDTNQDQNGSGSDSNDTVDGSTGGNGNGTDQDQNGSGSDSNDTVDGSTGNGGNNQDSSDSDSSQEEDDDEEEEEDNNDDGSQDNGSQDEGEDDADGDEEKEEEDSTTITRAMSLEGSTINFEGTFENGVVTVNEVEYKLTIIGDGTNSLNNITEEALTGNVDNVTTISASAFKGNTQIKTLSFPNVTTVESEAFADSSIEKIELGTNVTGEVTYATDAFNNIQNTVTVSIGSDITNTVSFDNTDNTNVVVPSTTPVVSPSTSTSSSSTTTSSSGANAAILNSASSNTTVSTTTSTTTNTSVSVTQTLTLDKVNLPAISSEVKSFSDVSSNYWAKEYIDKLSSAGIINGSNGSFNPNGQTKRADVTIMLVNLLGLTGTATSNFNDVNSNAYYANYVGLAKQYGIVNGSNGNFNPEDSISRQDTMVMISQILTQLELNVNTDTTALNQFSDVSNISGYAKESVAVLVNSGIINGNNGKINPKDAVTRAEMATIMSKLYDIINEAK